VSCPRLQVQKFPGCGLCQHTLQCHCSLMVDDITVHPRINNCDPTTQTTVTHAINIPLLSHFFDRDTIKNISDDQHLARDIILPPFNVRARDATIALQHDSQYAYSLKVVAKEAKTLEEIQLDPVTYIPEPTSTWFQYDQLPSIWPDTVRVTGTTLFKRLNIKFYDLCFQIGEQNCIRPIALIPISRAQAGTLQNIFSNEYSINFMITFYSTAAYLANPINTPTAPGINLIQTVAEY
jgi:hypothetical protein